MKNFINERALEITQYELEQIFIEFGDNHAKMICGGSYEYWSKIKEEYNKIMKNYRIVERKFDDGRCEFFPEYYDERYIKLSRIKHDGWISISEGRNKFLGIGYKSIEEAQIQINNHKRNKKPIGENVIDEKIHNID